MKSLRLLPALFAALVLVAPATGANSRPQVTVIDFDNDVNPVTAGYVTGARSRRAGGVRRRRDRPPAAAWNRCATSTRSSRSSEIPVIVYVPTGARAASAGVWIGQAADLLAMAPQSNLGSSTPVAAGGGEIPSDLKRKVVNDAAKSLRAIAEEHGRNGDWAEQAVRVASNLTAREALEMNVIDEIAPTLPAAEQDRRRAHHHAEEPRAAHGERRADRGEDVALEAHPRHGHRPEHRRPADVAGLLGITIELYSPGLILPGTVGVTSLILGLFGLQVLPTNWAGLLLMLLALAFFVADLFVPSHGVLTVKRAIAFVLGALVLFDPAGPLYDVSVWVAIAIAGTIVLLMVGALTKVVQARRRPAEVGAQSIVGTTGLRFGGQVFANGEL